jgi:hypothetical protein
MAVTKVGSAFTFGDTANTTTRNVTLPASLTTGDVIFMHVVGGSSTWFHDVASTGVTWVQMDLTNSLSGYLASLWRGYVTNGATASSSAVTVRALGADTITPQSFKLTGGGQVFRGTDNGGTSGANAANQWAKASSGAAATTIVGPFTAATTVAGCVLWSAGGTSRGTLPAYSSITYESGTPDQVGLTSGAVPNEVSASSTDLTSISLGATPGGKTFAFFDSTPAALTGGPRLAYSVAIAPAPAAPTVTGAIDQTDPAVGALLTLTGTVTGTATSRLWRQVSGPGSPAITNATTNTATVTPTLPGVYVFGFTATNAAGTSTEATVTAYVHPADGDPVPVVSVTYPAAWSLLNAGTAVANLNDSDASTGIQNASGTPTHTDKATLTFAPHGLGNITFELDSLYATTAVTARAIVYKADGVTQIYPTTGGDDWSPTTTSATHVVTLDSTALAAIPTLADRRALVVKVSAQ